MHRPHHLRYRLHHHWSPLHRIPPRPRAPTAGHRGQRSPAPSPTLRHHPHFALLPANRTLARRVHHRPRSSLRKCPQAPRHWCYPTSTSPAASTPLKARSPWLKMRPQPPPLQEPSSPPRPKHHALTSPLPPSPRAPAHSTSEDCRSTLSVGAERCCRDTTGRHPRGVPAR
ncbi:unannotated protein [freshwater metagenome]|uniref:Unannotated protein n=1 Tax=freshwater metagenome TaxID=449393 RepID=A0A6J6G3P7_9ZZZZ